MSSGLDIYRILHFIFCDKILQIYRQHWVRKCYRHILSKYRQITKKWESGVGVCVCVCGGGGVGGEWRGAKLTHTPPLNTPLLIPLDLDDAIVASSGQITTVMIWDGTLLKTNIGRSSPPDVFLGTSVLKICSKFTREHPWGSVISIKLRRRAPYPKNTCEGLLLYRADRNGIEIIVAALAVLNDLWGCLYH